MLKEEEKKYKRDYLRTIILLKEIEFFSDHLFTRPNVEFQKIKNAEINSQREPSPKKKLPRFACAIFFSGVKPIFRCFLSFLSKLDIHHNKKKFEKDPEKAIKQHIDEQIYLKYDFLPLNLLRESIGSYNAYCEDNEELTAKKRDLNKRLEFINHLRNKVCGHLSDEALDKMIQWIPEIYDENSKQNAIYQEYQIYRALIEIAINSYQTPEGDQKQFGKEIDIQIPEYRDLFFDYLLQTVNCAINFLECIQEVIRPKLVYFEYPKDERSNEEKVEFYKYMAELANECVSNPDKIDENTSKMREMFSKLGWDLDIMKEAAQTDFKLSSKGR